MSQYLLPFAQFSVPEEQPAFPQANSSSSLPKTHAMKSIITPPPPVKEKCIKQSIQLRTNLKKRRNLPLWAISPKRRSLSLNNYSFSISSLRIFLSKRFNFFKTQLIFVFLSCNIFLQNLCVGFAT